MSRIMATELSVLHPLTVVCNSSAISTMNRPKKRFANPFTGTPWLFHEETKFSKTFSSSNASATVKMRSAWYIHTRELPEKFSGRWASRSKVKSRIGSCKFKVLICRDWSSVRSGLFQVHYRQQSFWRNVNNLRKISFIRDLFERTDEKILVVCFI